MPVVASGAALQHQVQLHVHHASRVLARSKYRLIQNRLSATRESISEAPRYPYCRRLATNSPPAIPFAMRPASIRRERW